MGVDQNPVLSRPPPLLQTLVAGPLLQTLVADLRVEYCSLQGACRGGACGRTPLSVTNLCHEMAAQACYKANVLDSLPHSRVAVHGLKFTHITLIFFLCILLIHSPHYDIQERRLGHYFEVQGLGK